jgi:hypothetical protein
LTKSHPRALVDEETSHQLQYMACTCILQELESRSDPEQF